MLMADMTMPEFEAAGKTTTVIVPFGRWRARPHQRWAPIPPCPGISGAGGATAGAVAPPIFMFCAAPPVNIREP
jgi:hypothetical protein